VFLNALNPKPVETTRIKTLSALNVNSSKPEAQNQNQIDKQTPDKTVENTSTTTMPTPVETRANMSSTTKPTPVIAEQRGLIEQFLYISFFAVMGLVAFLVCFHLFEFYKAHVNKQKQRRQEKAETGASHVNEETVALNDPTARAKQDTDLGDSAAVELEEVVNEANETNQLQN
jgi:hypothetical protein